MSYASPGGAVRAGSRVGVYAGHRSIDVATHGRDWPLRPDRTPGPAIAPVAAARAADRQHRMACRGADQALGHPSWLQALSTMPAADQALIFRDITTGDNSVPQSQFGPAAGGYEATAGWDACTGLGSINGTALLQQVRSASAIPTVSAP
jgi:hypothetical protein